MTEYTIKAAVKGEENTMTFKFKCNAMVQYTAVNAGRGRQKRNF